MIKNKMWFFAEPDDNKGGGEEQSKGAAAMEKDTPPPPTPEPVPAPPPPTQVDAKEFATEFATAITKANLAAKEAPPVVKKLSEMSAEEAAKELGVWEPTPEWEAKFDNLATRQAALKELRDGVIGHSDKLIQRRLKEALEPYEARLGPISEFMSEAKEQRITDDFTKRYEQIANPALGDLRQAVVGSLIEKGQKFKSVGELNDAVAKGMEAVIQVTNPTFKLTAGSSPAKPKQPKGQSPNSIPVTTPGSDGGTGGKETGKPEQSRGAAVFAKS